MTPEWAAALVRDVVFAAIFFVLGVSYAIYRAVSWVERMRAWAANVTLSELDEAQP